MERAPRVLLIEDSPGDARLIRELLRGSENPDQTVDVRATLADGIEAARAGEWDVVLLDLGLPDSQGLEALRRLAAAVPEVPVVVLTGVEDETLGRKAIREGAQDYLPKAVLTTEIVVRAVRYAIDRARTARRLSESEGRFRRLAENAPDIVYRYRIIPEPGFEYISSAVEGILGYTTEEILGGSRAGIRLLHPEDRHHLRGLLRGVVAEEGPHAHRWIHKDGHIVWIEDRHTTIRDGDGRVVAIEGVARDVSEQVSAQSALAAERRRLFSVMDAMPAFVYLQASDHTIPFANREFRELFGDPGDRACHEILLGHDVPCRECPTLEGLSSGRSAKRTWTDRSGRTYGLVERAFKGSDGADLILVVGTDISERAATHEALAESEGRFRRILENAPDVIYRYRIAPSPGFDYISPAVHTIAGYAPEEYYADPLLGLKVVHPDDRHLLEGLIAGQADSEIYDVRWIHKDGRVVWTEDRHLPILDDEGNLLAIEGIARDITGWKEAQAALEMADDIVRSIPTGLLILEDRRSDGFLIASGNPSATQLVAAEEESLSGKRFEEVFPPPMIPKVESLFRRVLDGDGARDEEVVIRGEEGIRFAFHVRAFSISGARVVAAFEDITAQKRAEESLRKSEERYRELVEEIHDVIYAIDEEGALTYVSPSVEGLLGYVPEELVGSPYLSLAYSADVPSIDEMRSRFGRTKELKPEDYRLVAKDGSIRWVRTASRPIMDGGRFAGLRGVLIDVTERKRAEEALRVSEQQHRSLFENAALGIYQTTPDGRILAANPSLVRMLGYDSFEDLAARNLEEDGFESETPRERFKEQVEREGRLEGAESVWIRTDGRRLVVRENAVALRGEDGSILFYEGTIEDITARREAEEERENLEAQLRQTQRLESIGTLASGIAHEINNPLTGMINYAELISRRVEDERLKEFAEGIMSEGGRVAKIVRNLLSFSRQERESRSPARLVDILAATMTLVGALLKKDQITVETDVSDELPTIICRSQQIQQVLLNLLTNARDALNDRYPKHNPDKIVRVMARQVTEEGKGFLRTVVEDHGSGIPEGVIDRVFDPFFTTKPRDRGTGLGLSVSYGIVRDHGGRLSVESESDEYTRFILDLPLGEGETEVGDG